MKSLFVFTLTLLPLLASAEPIFDGKSLSGWTGNADIWRVEDGAITASIKEGEQLGKNEFLYWDGEIADFELELEFRITGPGANSGIQIRSGKDKTGHAVGYQADMDAGKTWLGRIYDEHGRALIAERGALTKIHADGRRFQQVFRPADDFTSVARQNEWNTYHILARGHRIEISINGIRFTVLEDRQVGEADLHGLLAMQLHSGKGPAKIQFRNIQLKDMGRTEPAADEEPEIPDEENSIVPADAPNIGFEKGTYEGWKAEGALWGDGPEKGDTIVARGRGNSVHEGEFWSGGYEKAKSDAGQGTLTSDPFQVTHRWATIRIGAAPGPDTRVEILDASDQSVLHTFRGRGQVEDMERTLIDLEKSVGKKIQIRLVDQSSGLWGHLNYDDFRFYEQRPDLRSVNAGSRIESSPLLWELRRNPSLDESVASTEAMWVPEGFAVEAVASEPLLHQPIAFTFDARGRIWVAEAMAYPRRRDDGEANDRILILEDVDHDGTFETHKVFAEGLNLVSGFEIGYGGVFVAAAPEMLFIPDQNGDDVPDGDPVVLLDGFDNADTHETPNSFLWGNDGWLYGCHGVFNKSKVGKPGTPEAERTYMEAAIWRLHPVTHEFQIYATGGSNQWGLTYNDAGELFMTHCRSAWGLGPVTQVFRDAAYWSQANRNHLLFIAAPAKGYKHHVIGENNFFPSIAAYGHGEGGAGLNGSKAVFGGHSHVGTMIYLGDNWPEEYRGNLFTNNLHGSQINREVLLKHDSAWQSSSYGLDPLYCEDPTYLGVHLKYGPDGAVYITDWVDTQQCHNNDVEIWDRTNGRMYRMAWTETWKPVAVDLNSESSTDMLAYLDHPNEWYFQMGQHILRQRRVSGEDQTAIATSLRQRLLDRNSSQRLRTLIYLNAVGGLDIATCKQLLADADEVIARQALQFFTDGDHQQVQALGAELVNLAKTTDSASMRLHLALASQNRIPEPFARQIVDILSLKAEDANDRFIGKAVWFAYSKYAAADRAASFALAKKTPLASLRRSIIWDQAKEDLSDAMEQALQLETDEQAAEAVSMILQSLDPEATPSAPDAWPALRDRALRVGGNKMQTHIGELNNRFAGAVTEKKIPSTGEPVSGAKEVLIKAIAGLQFDQKVVEVVAGESISLTLQNDDAIPHNWVLVKPGAGTKVGEAAEKMLTDPDGYQKHYVPDSDDVLHWIPIINGNGQKHILHFQAPKEAGDYPYICTFPGHWRVMVGTLRVLAKRP